MVLECKPFPVLHFFILFPSVCLSITTHTVIACTYIHPDYYISIRMGKV